MKYVDIVKIGINKIVFVLLFVFYLVLSSYSQNNLKVIYTSPKQNSIYNSPNANIVIKFNKELSNQDFNNLKVEISSQTNKQISGELRRTSKTNTFLFKPKELFENGEQILVNIYKTFGHNEHEQIYNFQFETSKETLPYSIEKHDLEHDMKESSFHKLNSQYNTILAKEYRLNYNLPDDFPATIITNKNKPLPGNYFLSSRFIGPPSGGTNYMFCIDTCGTPIFYKALNNRGSDFRRQPNGYLTHFPGDVGKYVQYDSSYNEMRTYSASNGYLTDMHELYIEDDGSYWLFTKQLHVIDMSIIVPGGNSQATVEENIIQQLDYSGNLLFQWNSLDHIPITDCDPNFVDLTGSYIDYIHVNALDFDDNGNLLLSSRHLNEITKINIVTGNIIWRCGGSKNQFTFINDENGYYGQHSIRYNGGGNYSLFDNGNWHLPPRSRGLEYFIDELNMTATLINEYITNDGLSYSAAMGHMQRTDDGGTLIGWAANTQGYVLTDYKPDGSKALDIMNLDTNLISYRAYKYEWETNSFYFTSDTIEFDGVILPGDSVTTNAIVYNNTNNELTISGYHSNLDAFSVVNYFPTIIAPNSQMEFIISFNPVNENYYNDVLTLYSNSQNDSMRISIQTRIIGGLITSLTDNEAPIGILK